jgi:hypothetical protein
MIAHSGARKRERISLEPREIPWDQDEAGRISRQGQAEARGDKKRRGPGLRLKYAGMRGYRVGARCARPRT